MAINKIEKKKKEAAQIDTIKEQKNEISDRKRTNISFQVILHLLFLHSFIYKTDQLY